MCSVLTASGYECLQAISPKKAWAILGSEKEVDVVLCSLIESSEEELVERITKTFPDIPVVVVSAFDDSSVVGVALRKGAYDFLRKPFGREQLLAIAKRALEYRRLKLENRALQAKVGKAETRTGLEEKMMTMQDVRERCYDIRHYLPQIIVYAQLGQMEKAEGAFQKVDDMAFKMLIDATEAAKGTPDYRPEPYKLPERH